jgi:hypothetical protein
MVNLTILGLSLIVVATGPQNAAAAAAATSSGVFF